MNGTLHSYCANRCVAILVYVSRTVAICRESGICVDGNGRTARLLMNLALLQEGYPITIIPPVLRSEYLDAVRRGNYGEVEPFVNLLSNMVWESQRDYLRLLQNLERK